MKYFDMNFKSIYNEINLCIWIKYIRLEARIESEKEIRCHQETNSMEMRTCICQINEDHFKHAEMKEKKNRPQN